MPARDRLPALVLGLATPAVLAVASGGYFPRDWGIASAGFLLAAAAAVIVADRVAFSRLDAVFVGGLLAFGLWQLASAAWAPSPGRPVLEAERTLVYLALALAAVAVVGRRRAAELVGGVLAGTATVAAGALATRLLPGTIRPYDPQEGYQLAEPIGYWNGLGILTAVALLLALGHATQARPPVAAAAAATLPVLAATLTFTFSRGAWAALAAGLAVLAALERDRVRFAALALPPLLPAAAAVALAVRADALTTQGAPLAAARADGRTLAAALLVLTAAAAGAALAARRVHPPAWARRAFAVTLAVGAAFALAAAAHRVGNPATALDRAAAAFREPLPDAAGDLPGRLTSVSGNGRSDYWRVAWRQVEREPLRGTGAGTYERAWMRERPTAFAARDAHSLYLETLAELGPAGLALLLVTLSAPLLAIRRARREALAAATAGAYAAFLAHAALDWDWELPAVTGTALLLGSALLAWHGREAVPLTSRRRAAALAALAPLGLAAAVAHAGNRAAATAAAAIDRGDGAAAVEAAERARRFAPWSTEPVRLLGEARLASGDEAGALRALEEGLARDPDDWELWYDLAVASHGRERERAVAEGLARNPRSPELAELAALDDR